MIKKLSSKQVYANKWMSVREDEVEFDNGHQGIYGVVDKQPFALIVPFDGQRLYLVKQFRYPIQRDSWEFPQGMHEDEAGTDSIKLASDELKEETGFRAASLTELGQFCVAVGFCSQECHAHLAEDLTEEKQSLEITEADLEIGSFTINEFRDMLRKGEIVDSPTIAAFALFSDRLDG